MEIAELIRRASLDCGLKKRLMLDPRAVLSEHGFAVPHHVEIRVRENTPTRKHVVIGKQWLHPAPGGLHARLVRHLNAEPEAKAKFLAGPAEFLALLGIRVPPGLEVVAVENTSNVRHIVLGEMWLLPSAERSEWSPRTSKRQFGIASLKSQYWK